MQVRLITIERKVNIIVLQQNRPGITPFRCHIYKYGRAYHHNGVLYFECCYIVILSAITAALPQMAIHIRGIRASGGSSHKNANLFSSQSCILEYSGSHLLRYLINSVEHAGYMIRFGS